MRGSSYTAMNLEASTRIKPPTRPSTTSTTIANTIGFILSIPLSYRIALMMFSTRPPKPIKLSDVMAAETSVMGKPLKLSGGLEFSTR